VPARVTPFDALIALASGWQAPPELPDPGLTAAQQASAALGGGSAWSPETPCPFLSRDRCAFPDHLRPCGCAAFLCRPIYAEMDRKQTARVRRLIREMERAYEAVKGTRRQLLDR